MRTSQLCSNSQCKTQKSTLSTLNASFRPIRSDLLQSYQTQQARTLTFKTSGLIADRLTITKVLHISKRFNEYDG